MLWTKGTIWDSGPCWLGPANQLKDRATEMQRINTGENREDIYAKGGNTAKENKRIIILLFSVMLKFCFKSN